MSAHNCKHITINYYFIGFKWCQYRTIIQVVWKKMCWFGKIIRVPHVFGVFVGCNRLDEQKFCKKGNSILTTLLFNWSEIRNWSSPFQIESFSSKVKAYQTKSRLFTNLNRYSLEIILYKSRLETQRTSSIYLSGHISWGLTKK